MAEGTQNGHRDSEAVTPYSMHVSLRYLELTKKKLELTRLPRELELPEARRWEHGTPKSVLEPLLDFWLDGYDWRAAETQFNSSLPQFRTTIATPSTTDDSATHSLRIHFVHKRSKHPNAIPLLVCHSWPSSFIEVQRIIDALTDPHSLPSFGEGAQQAFHVVAPSIPGFGFSDASSAIDFGVRDTAAVFDRLMARLGYERYVAHGVGWGFSICRALAMQHPAHCLAVHTADPSFAAPTVKQGPMAFLKYKVAKLIKGKWSGLSFGYVPNELISPLATKLGPSTQNSLYSDRPLGLTLHRLYSLRPQTLSFSLCDSPVGLLAALLDVIHTRVPSGSPLTSRSRSPFLSPVELEMRDSGGVQAQSGHERVREEDIEGGHPVSPRQSEMDARNYTWSPTEILNWTMMQWLPGPESSLRWLRQAHLDTTTPHWNDYCGIPLGISSFRARNSNTTTPLMWGSTSWQIGWVKRHQRPATLPAWEAPDLLVLDLRECFGTFLSDGKLANLPLTAS
ncbi:alpha/beta-hydrolase [Setomelanomma holmii]|uniref:Alpha/beta-hydrolase n=1 Tax=Setomelanomma holmii TaxID=210430 RepID=A0A9P4GVZ4_9PLEO|nr:alpha/beta-hydrolase [Setomelanomma holmii]